MPRGTGSQKEKRKRRRVAHRTLQRALTHAVREHSAILLQRAARRAGLLDCGFVLL